MSFVSFVSFMRGSRKASAGLCLVLAALLTAVRPTGPAAADTVQAADDADRPPGGGDATRVQSYAREFPPSAIEGAKLESLLGRDLRTRNDDPGRIIDILCDRDGLVRAAVVELGGFLGIGTRKIAVDWSMLRFEAGQKQPSLVLDMTRDQLRSAPEYKAGEPVVFVRRTD
jgi:PRC-barrel domain